MDKDKLEALIRNLVEEHLGRNNAGSERGPEPGPFPRAGLKVVTEREVRDAGLGGFVRAENDAIVTAAAEDLARSTGVTILRGEREAERCRKVALGSDHGGYALKEEVGAFLRTMPNVEVIDLGTSSEKPVDYPDYAQAVAETVASGRADFGIVLDGAGIGSAMTANKVPGIRAAMCYDEATAKNSREHNFANVLTLGGRLIPAEKMRGIVRTFLETAPGEERHAARVRKIMAVERKYRKN